MFTINFDELEWSLEVTIQKIKRNDLLEAASLASSHNRPQELLRKQLEDQSGLLLRLKDHYIELRATPAWPQLQEQAHKLFNIRRLFSEEEAAHYEQFKAQINQLITELLNKLDATKNDKIIKQARKKANSNVQVKIYKNWTKI